jgi:hypothetical protein
MGLANVKSGTFVGIKSGYDCGKNALNKKNITQQNRG